MEFKQFLKENNMTAQNQSPEIVFKLNKYCISQQKLEVSRIMIYNLFVLEKYVKRYPSISQSDFERMVCEVKTYKHTFERCPNRDTLAHDLRKLGALHTVSLIDLQNKNKRKEKKRFEREENRNKGFNL